jgi:alpha-glucoside transport system permease protein
MDQFVDRLPAGWREGVRPYVFVGPALVMLSVFLIYPVFNTIVLSFKDARGNEWVGLDNYEFVFTDESMLRSLRNTAMWIVLVPAAAVSVGLLFATLADRLRRGEAVAKSIIFLPLAISFVGASVIWRFMYEWKPAAQPQIGLVNAVWSALGGEPIRWVQTQPINTYALILIFVWIWTGFAMVVLSAAIKGVSVEVIEAARLDGANERQIFFRVIVPIIKGSIITVGTTIAIAVLKIFDIIYVMTGGRNGTDVIANRMFTEFYEFFNDGRAAALATLLFIAVLPVMVINVRNLRRQGIGS